VKDIMCGAIASVDTPLNVTTGHSVSLEAKSPRECGGREIRAGKENRAGKWLLERFVL
jgi:hypothetical protein